VELGPQVKKALQQNNLKLGLIFSKLEAYASVNKRFKCCSFNHRAIDCRGEEIWSFFARRHRLQDYTASRQEYKCVNYKRLPNSTRLKPSVPTTPQLKRNVPACRPVWRNTDKTQTTDMASIRIIYTKTVTHNRQ